MVARWAAILGVLFVTGPISGLWLWMAHRARSKGRPVRAMVYLACIPLTYVALAAVPGLMLAAAR